MTSPACHPRLSPCAVGCEPGRAFDPSRHCHRCWRFAHVARDREGWGGDAAGVVPVVAVPGVARTPAALHVATPPISGGVGRELAAVLRSVGVDGFAGCGCSDRAALMDRHGPGWVRANRGTVEGWLRQAAAKASWLTHLRAGVGAARHVLSGRINPLDPAPGLLDLALARHALSATRPVSLAPLSRELVDTRGFTHAHDRGPFNGGEYVHRGRRLFAYRVGLLNARIHVAELDQAAAVVRDVPLDLSHPRITAGADDPVLSACGGRLRVWFVGSWDDHRRGQQFYADLTDDLRVERVYHPKLPGQSDRWEKNWSPFEWGGEQYAVYSIKPHVVVKIDGDRAERVFERPYPFAWAGGHLRGGAAPVLVGDRFYHWFHGKIEPRNPLLYSIGVYTFAAKPPFAPIAGSPLPLAWGDDAEAARLGCEFAVIFPRGAILRDGAWEVTGGEYDTRLARWRWDAAAVDRLLAGSPVRPALRPTGSLPGVQTPAPPRGRP